MHIQYTIFIKIINIYHTFWWCNKCVYLKLSPTKKKRFKNQSLVYNSFKCAWEKMANYVIILQFFLNLILYSVLGVL